MAQDSNFSYNTSTSQRSETSLKIYKATKVICVVQQNTVQKLYNPLETTKDIMTHTNALAGYSKYTSSIPQHTTRLD